MGNVPPDPLDIPAFLKRDASNKAEFMMSEAADTPEHRPAKSKAGAKGNGHDKAPVKAKGKPPAKAAVKVTPKAKTAPKAPAKAAKPVAKAKVAKAKAEPTEKDQFGLRKGSSKSKAAAMYARKNGATLEEVKEALGSVQLNVLSALEEEGHTVTRSKEERKGKRPATRYVLRAK
jgi:hypothetical protein